MPDLTEDPSLPRKRDASATADAILAAAREVFTHKGYDGAGTREIAERAQVNVALISRYFGSKEGLFAAAVPPMMTLDAVLAGEMSGFGARLAANLTHKQIKTGFDPILALLRAASSPEAVPILRQALSRQVHLPLAARLEGPNPLERAALIGALVVGFDLLTRVLGLQATSGDTSDGMEQSLAKSVQALVDQH